VRVADLIIRILRQQQVETVFGYPGGSIMPIYDALHGSDLRHVLCRHEQGAAFAAGGYARASGKPGVCLATSGPGVTNLLTGLADALLDSVPVVAITGQAPTSDIGTDAFQEVDTLGLSLSVTKHSYLITAPGEVSGILQEAFQVATTNRPGPVLVDIPKDIQMAETDVKPTLKIADEKEPLDLSLVEAARGLLTQAARPVAYIGGGVALAGAVEQLRSFLNKTRVPSVTTLKGIGTVSPDDPYFLGLLGMHGNPAANKAVQGADLLICIGARFDDRVTGKLDAFAPNAKIIHLDVDAAEVNKRRKADVGLLGSLCDILPRLGQPLDISSWRAECRALKRSHAWSYRQEGESIHAPSLLKRLSETMDKETVVCTDVGQHQMWVAQHMIFDRPTNHLSSGGLGAMGFGLPTAIGAQMARPRAVVINISGDGSFMMNVQELATIRRYRLPIKIIVIDNQRLGMVRQWQELFFEERYSETDLSDNPDFVKLAEVFQIQGQSINRLEEVSPALEELLNAKQAYLLHVRIEPEANVWPLVPPGAANDDLMEETA
jgi:acetolactate synthase-1/2/3 large subunit